MTAVNDLFVASIRELGVMTEPGSPVGLLPGLRDSGIDLMMLCTLEGILTGTDWESVFDEHYMNPVREDGPEGPWVYAVSEVLLQALLQLGPDSIESCAGRWADTDEWTVHENNGMDRIVKSVRDLISLARDAANEHKHVFLWTSL